MNTAFSFILAAGILSGLSFLICIVYISYKVSESFRKTTLMDAKFPETAGYFDKKDFAKNAEAYFRPTSDARIAMGSMYTEERVEQLRRKASPQKFPKGRYK